MVGTFVTAVVNLALTIISKRSEERKQLNELMINAGIEQHARDLEAAYRLNEKTSRNIIVPPLETYIIHNYLLVNVLGGGNYRPKQLKQKLDQMDADYKDILASRNYKNPDGTPANLT